MAPLPFIAQSQIVNDSAKEGFLKTVSEKEKISVTIYFLFPQSFLVYQR